jgi:hypothetical protein
LLDNFQNLEEIHKIIVFETGFSVEEIAKRIGYSRPHLALILGGKGSEKVRNELLAILKREFEKEILQFVRRYGKIKTPADPANVISEVNDKLSQFAASLDVLQKTSIIADARQQVGRALLISIHLGERQNRTVGELLEEWDTETVKLAGKMQKDIQTGAGSGSKVKLRT